MPQAGRALDRIHGDTMTVKFIQYWDVLSEQENEFSKFVAKNYIPGINETGYLKIVGSWHVASGEGPYFIMEGVADSVKNVHSLLQLDEFKKLSHLLHFLITNYKSKLLVSTGPIEGVVPEDRNYRFNHHYDVIYDKFDNYITFMKDEHIPIMEELGVKLIGAWKPSAVSAIAGSRRSCLPWSTDSAARFSLMPESCIKGKKQCR